jgi:hypothetical protein
VAGTDIRHGCACAVKEVRSYRGCLTSERHEDLRTFGCSTFTIR